MELKYMDLEDFEILVMYINNYHSFNKMHGKAIKYVTPVYDTRIGKIFGVNLRRAGEGKDFYLVNEDKDRDLKEWIVDWLDNGSWEESE